MLTQDYLRECFSYKPDTGVLYWKARPRNHFPTDRGWKIFNSRFAGTVAGCLSGNGYLRVTISGKKHLVHRIIWCLVTGAFPEHEIDHINQLRTDNRIKNMRDTEDNHRNYTKRSDNTSGCTGVSWRKQAQKWQAHIRVGGRREHLGYFDTFEEAVAARKGAEGLYGFHHNHGSPKPQQAAQTP